MDKGYFLLCCMPGFALAFAVFIPLGARRRASVPPPGWWLCLIAGGTGLLYGLSHSTTPSFAPRVAAVGNLFGMKEGHHGRDLYFSFRLLRDGEPPLDLETQIVLPHWGSAEARTLRVVYLEDGGRTVKNEAVDIAIVAGRDAGFQDSLDARPAGTWLLIPLGAAFFGFGMLGPKYMKDDEAAASREEDDAAVST